MITTVKQKTIKKEISLSGVGLHTGKEVKLTFKPAPENYGFVFIRTDLTGNPIIEANVNYVVDTKRGTNLEKNGVKINTSEHVLAAVVGMGINNIIIELNSAEPPIMDGSSKYFTEALEKVGLIEQEALVKEYVIKEVISYKDSKTGSEIMVMPSDKFEITTMVDFGTKVLGTQNATLSDISDFKTEISAARTFSFLHEIEMLLDSNLIKGGDLNNAIVYVDKELSEETMSKLRIAFKKESVKVRRTKVPCFDLSKPPLMDIHQIMEILPHRFPFLLIDRILELTKTHVVGMKNVTMNEPFFQGHFPGSPVMPGVLQIEAMAQCGGVLVLSTVPDPHNYLTYFMKMDNVKFKRKVLPGDTLIFRAELISPIRRGICHMQAYAYANDKLVAEAELMAQIVKK